MLVTQNACRLDTAFQVATLGKGQVGCKRILNKCPELFQRTAKKVGLDAGG